MEDHIIMQVVHAESHSFGAGLAGWDVNGRMILFLHYNSDTQNDKNELIWKKYMGNGKKDNKTTIYI